MIATVIIFSGLQVFAQDDNNVPPPMNKYQNAEGHTLVLRNNTGKQVTASFAYFDRGDNCWVSKGWWNIEPYGSKTLNLNESNIGSNTIYVHAHSIFKSWGTEFTFCADEHKAFRILYADQANCYTKKQYFQIQFENGEKTVIFNP